ncbi:MAG: hypothetical protein ABL984_00355 [Pyrinomonadaceae bacterium]
MVIRTDQAKRDLEVARTIQSQLGRAFTVMVGATNLTCGNEGGLSFLEFRFRMFPKANRLRIVLDSDDTYTLRFYRIRGAKVSVYAEESTVYADKLGETFRKVTR